MQSGVRMRDGSEMAQWKVTGIKRAGCGSGGVDYEAIVNGRLIGAESKRNAFWGNGREKRDVACRNLVLIEFEELVRAQSNDSAFYCGRTWIDMEVAIRKESSQQREILHHC